MTTLFAIIVMTGIVGVMLLTSLGIVTVAEFILYRKTGMRYIDVINKKSRPGCGNTQDGSEKSTHHQYTGNGGKCQ